MTFLNPAVLFGLLAASIPILIHLLNLRKLKKIEFSSLSFLKELQKNKIRKIKLRQWLLLLLRVATILFLVTAFARPTLRGLAIGGTASAAKTTAVFILDDTFSMELLEDRGSRFNQSKAAAEAIVSRMQEGDDAAFIMVSGTGDEPRLTTNLLQLKKQIAGSKPSAVSGTLHAAVVKAAQLLQQSNNYNKELYLLSDLQQSRLAEDSSFSNLGDALNEKVRAYVLRFTERAVFNNAVTALTVNTAIFQKGKPVSVTAGVSNYGAAESNNTVVSLFINGERAAQASVAIAAGATREVTLEGMLKKDGYQEIVASLEDDELTADNRRYTAVMVPERITVGIFCESPADAQLPELAISAADNSTAIITEIRSTEQLATANLNRYNLLIVGAGAGQAAPERIRDYVTRGGGVLLFPASGGNWGGFEALTAALQLPPLAGVGGKAGGEASVRFSSVDDRHPLFYGLFTTKEQRSVASPDIYAWARLFPGASGRPIITLGDKTAFLSEYRLGRGNVLLLAVPPSAAYSTLPFTALFPPLVYRSVFYLGSTQADPEAYITGGGIPVPTVGAAGGQITATLPNGTDERITISGHATAPYITFTQTALAGNYVFRGAGAITSAASVNTDRKESLGGALTPEAVRSYFAAIGAACVVKELPADADAAALVQQERFGAELWRVFLLLALLAATAEMLVARAAKKELPAAGN